MQQRPADSSDLTLVLKNGTEIRASRNELSEGSDFFSALLGSDMKENREGVIQLEHITETVMIDVLDFIRSGRVNVTSENAIDLCVAADYLLIPNLKTIVGRFIEEKYKLSASDCLSIYYFAERYRLASLAFNSRKFIFSNFAAVAKSEDFFDLKSREVEQWICSDELAVAAEDDVFKIILEWIEQNKSERKAKFEELFPHVRLAFVSRDYLLRDVVTNNLVTENSICLKLVMDAVNGLTEGSQLPRKWSDSHVVVFTGKETFCYQPDEDSWYQLADAPLYKHRQYQMTPFQGKLYVFPCRAACHAVTGEMYDPLLNRWAGLGWTFQHFPTQTHKSAVVIVNGGIYSVSQTGRTGVLKISTYNVELNSWHDVPIWGFKNLEDKYFGYGSCSVVVDNHIYLLGGQIIIKGLKPKTLPNVRKKSAGRFNTITNKWEFISEMNLGRSNACGTAAHGKIFIAGGELFSDNVRTNTCEVYNVESNEWQLIANLNAPRSHGSMVCFKGTLFVVGGVYSGQYGCPGGCSLALAVESYDFQKDEWKKRTKIPIDKVFQRKSKKIVKACTLHVTDKVLGEPIKPGLRTSFKHRIHRK